MQPWLDKQDVEKVVGELVESFPYEAKLSHLVALAVSGWLTDLIGPTKVEELRAAFQSQYGDDPDSIVALTDDQKSWAALIRPFLASYVWSRYIKNANVTNTKTGPVTKLNDKSDPIDREQRESISSDYYNEAKMWAVRIAKKAKAANACSSPVVGSGRTSVSVVKGKHKSYFLDGPGSYFS